SPAGRNRGAWIQDGPLRAAALLVPSPVDAAAAPVGVPTSQGQAAPSHVRRAAGLRVSGIEGLKRRLRTSVWHPRWIAVAYIAPILEGIRTLIHGTVLDVGCGARPHESRLARDATRYVGLDRPGPGPARPDRGGGSNAPPGRDTPGE